jgi:hypothetical protein
MNELEVLKKRIEAIVSECKMISKEVRSGEWNDADAVTLVEVLELIRRIAEGNNKNG